MWWITCCLFIFRYVYCTKCFGEIQGDTVTLGDDPLTATVIPKASFSELKNNTIDKEEYVLLKKHINK